MSRRSDVPWSDLPFDVVTSIAERFPTFPMTELLLFGSVCKTWRQASLNVRLRRRLSMPWLIQVSPKTYIDGTVPGIRSDLSDFWSEQTLSFARLRQKPVMSQLLIHASCNGWLLLSDRIDGVNRYRDTSFLWFLLYNPFRNMTIELPPLFVEAHTVIIVSRGTASPASHDDDDCDVFVTCGRSGPDSGKMRTIYTCNLKDKKWRYRDITRHEKQLHDVLYMDGAFYCVCVVGLSVVMDVFTFRSDYRAVGRDPFFASSFSCSLSLKENDKLYLVEADGEFWLAVYSPDETRNCCHIYQFDRSEKEWSRVKSLGNRVLMLSCNVPIESIVVPAVQNAEQFANMILVLGRSTYDSYICEDGTEGTWRFDKMHDLNPEILNNVRIEPPPLWR